MAHSYSVFAPNDAHGLPLLADVSLCGVAHVIMAPCEECITVPLPLDSCGIASAHTRQVMESALLLSVIFWSSCAQWRILCKLATMALQVLWE